MTKMSVIIFRTITKTHIPKRHHDFENPIQGKMFDNTQDRIYGEQQQQIYILSDAESINDGGQAKPIHAIVHTQRNSGTLPKAAKELRQSNTNRSLTLQSQGARSIGLN